MLAYLLFDLCYTVLDVPFPRSTPYGSVADTLTASAAGLRQGVRISRGNPRFHSRETETFWEQPEAQDRIRIVSGWCPTP